MVKLTQEQYAVYRKFKDTSSFYLFLKAINDPKLVPGKDAYAFTGWGLTSEQALMIIWLDESKIEVLPA